MFVPHVDNFCHNTPFAACHSRGTKPPCWDAKVSLGQDKRRKLPFKILYAICFSCPSATFASQHGGFVLPCEWQAAKGLLCYLSTPVSFNQLDRLRAGALFLGPLPSRCLCRRKFSRTSEPARRLFQH